MLNNWTRIETERYKSRAKRYMRRHPREFAAVENNLIACVELSIELNVPINAVKAKFVHHEGRGIIAIGQEGGYGKGLQKTRLYVYFDTGSRTYYMLCIGGNDRQSLDVQYCKNEIKKRLAKKKRQKGVPYGSEQS